MTPKSKRPRSVTILATLQTLQSLGLLAYGIYLIASNGWVGVMKSGGLKYIPFPMFESTSSGIVVILLAFATLAIALALFRLKGWAWNASITIQGLGLLTGLVAYFRGRPNYIGLLVGIILVLYLNRGEVQEVFHGKRSRAL